jgi:hypothetical protein
MAFSLRLARKLVKQGWKVKIRDKERLEPPHVTILRFTRVWRLSLRDGTFLEEDDRWNQIHDEVRQAVENEWETLRAEWDRLYPDNPVSAEE